MEYNQEKALEIIIKYNLSPITAKVWKTRGRIPEKYLNDTFIPRILAQNRADMAQYNRGMEVFSNPKINTSALLEVSGVSKSSYFDAIRKSQEPRVMLDFNSFLTIKKELNRYRIKVKSLIEELANKQYYSDFDKKRLDQLFFSNIICVAQLIGCNRNDPQDKSFIAYHRLLARNRGRMSLHEDWEVEYVIDRFSIFLLETSI
ncbi:hypothetical protein CLV98_1233 [Dyadobacter jejuensis]|uniref:Uncharacterized protein n=1 Tax=Dyadobacter jejuensis TaxID=1082580 RepID=A0A316A8T1_9BACT|nr:hypothetical protein [Dyadobacter jejuensis]PWJ53390.1 hypothetical protein CLV98_1233 [Dyadobacter jejuensis]